MITPSYSDAKDGHQKPGDPALTQFVPRRLIVGVLALAMVTSLHVATPNRAGANPIFGGLFGAIAGTAIGGILGGGGGARAGAILGGIGGALTGAGAEAQRAKAKRKYYRARYFNRPIFPPRVAVAPNATVLSIQQSLTRLGFNPGPIDGKPGPATASAIRAYQQQYGLLVTGQPSQALAQHMLRNGG